MLKRFQVSGFKNFKDTITLDFSDVRNYNFSTSYPFWYMWNWILKSLDV